MEIDLPKAPTMTDSARIRTHDLLIIGILVHLSRSSLPPVGLLSKNNTYRPEPHEKCIHTWHVTWHSFTTLQIECLGQVHIPIKEQLFIASVRKALAPKL